MGSQRGIFRFPFGNTGLAVRTPESVVSSAFSAAPRASASTPRQAPGVVYWKHSQGTPKSLFYRYLVGHQGQGEGREPRRSFMSTQEIAAALLPPDTEDSKPTSNGSYTGSDIKVLEGLEAVRLRPAMYIGSTGEMGLHHLVYEVVDNSVDEALAGHATHVDVTIHLDNSVTVVDNGRGIPVDMHEDEGVSAAQVVMTKLHAGGKFDSKSYKVSGGLHGVGVSCVNALSERLELEIWREGFTWQQQYACGIPKGPLKKTGKAGKKTGTKVTFKADPTIMDATAYNYDTLAQRLRELAFLNKGLIIRLTDERVDPIKNHEFHYSGGIAEFIKHLNRGKSVLHDKPIHFEADRDLPNGGR